jgi:DNA-binding transcriptional ArsR family regulator
MALIATLSAPSGSALRNCVVLEVVGVDSLARSIKAVKVTGQSAPVRGSAFLPASDALSQTCSIPTLSCPSSIFRRKREDAIRTYFPKEPRGDELEISSVLYALSDPIRLDIVRQLSAVHTLACGHFQIAKPKSSLSHHFRVLRESGVVATRRNGTALLNSLRRQDLELRFPGPLKAVIGSVPKRGRSTRH